MIAVTAYAQMTVGWYVVIIGGAIVWGVVAVVVVGWLGDVPYAARRAERARRVPTMEQLEAEYRYPLAGADDDDDDDDDVDEPGCPTG